jgi:hypothetical protein
LIDRIKVFAAETTGGALDKFFRVMDSPNTPKLIAGGLFGASMLPGVSDAIAVARIASQKILGEAELQLNVGRFMLNKSTFGALPSLDQVSSFFGKMFPALPHPKMKFGSDFVGPLRGIDERVGDLEPEMFEENIGAEARADALRRIKSLEDQIHDAQLRGMSVEQRRLVLMADRLKAQKDLTELQVMENEGFDTNEEQLKAKLKIADITGDLANLHDPKVKQPAEIDWTRDDLAKIGGFTANVDNSGNNFILQSIAESTRETAENTRQVEGGGW